METGIDVMSGLSPVFRHESKKKKDATVRIQVAPLPMVHESMHELMINRARVVPNSADQAILPVLLVIFSRQIRTVHLLPII
jgi:hypothetical protein